MKAALIGLSPSVGMQYYTAGLANALASKKGYEVWVIGSAAARRNAFDDRVKLLPAPSFSGTGVSLSALNLRNFRALLKQVDNLDPSLVHFTGPHVWNLPLALYLRRRWPLILSQHDATTHKGAKGETLKGAYRRAMMGVVDCVVVHSRTIAEAFANWGGSLPPISFMPLVHHNFDYQRYREIRINGCGGISYEDSALLFGRLEEYKGVREFLGATHVLNSLDVTPIKMVVAGAGRLSSELENFKGLPNLELRNYLIEDDETIDLFSRAGLIVLPYSEGSQSALIPLAYLFQKPVLVTRVGALPEYVQDGVTGQVIDSNEPTLLARAIHNLISNKTALVQMGRAGRGFLLELERQFGDNLVDTYSTVAQAKVRIAGQVS